MNDTEAQRKAISNYLRGRLTAVERSKGMHGLVLVCSYLGTLAENWMATSEEPVETTPADRVRLFLDRHGHHDAWSRVSAPFLRARITSVRERTGIEARFPFEQFEPDRINPIATWKNDPTFSELEASRLIDRTHLIECSHAGLVYEELISKCDDHRWTGTRAFETPWHDEQSNGSPRYRYDSLTHELRLIVPGSFCSRPSNEPRSRSRRKRLNAAFYRTFQGHESGR